MTESLVLSSEVPMNDGKKYSVRTYFTFDEATMIAEYRTAIFEHEKLVCEFFSTKTDSIPLGIDGHCQIVKRVASSGIDELFREYSRHAKRCTVRVCVAGRSDNGPDLFFVKVYCDDDQLEQGKHYEAAKAWVKANFSRSEPVWACDEYDPCDRVMEPVRWNEVETIRVK